MIQQIKNISKILDDKGYSTVFLENADFETVLFYKSDICKQIIYGVICDKNSLDKYIYVGNILLNYNKQLVLGCSSAIEKSKLTAKKLFECIDYIYNAVENEYKRDYLDHHMKCIQKFSDVENVVNRYAVNENFHLSN